jgi:UDP-N-acetylmuramate dehydrogenase
MLIRENVLLAPMTTFNVGGPARYFTEARTIEDVNQAVAQARKKSLPLFVLGGGSNLVISDAGWPGLVLRMGITGIERRSSSAIFEVGAGEEWDKFVGCAVSHNCAGVECLSGIPGSTGGTPVQNVGAYGQEVAETIESVLVLDTRDNEIRELCNEACGFAYRTSTFNSSERGRFIVLRVDFALREGGTPGIHYADLKRYFAEREKPSTLAEVREVVRNIRASKGMLITPGDEDCRSAGSFFKNPVLPDPEYKSLHERAQERGLQIPSYPALNVYRKISAAWLVENSGFPKGYSHGPVGISRKHALAIVNRGGAKAADIIALKNEIQQGVGQKWGIQLQAEPVFVGFENS